jgi:hypothetical protein
VKITMANDQEEKKSGRETINLKHVETKKQVVDKEKLADLFMVKDRYEADRQTDLKLTNDDKTILSSFQKKRMMLDRIWIIMNQSRTSMNIEPIARDDLKAQLLKLVDLGYLTHEVVEYNLETNDVFILTEKGEEELI